MKRSLLLLAVLAGLLAAVPGYGQYVFLDVNGDRQNSHASGGLPPDVLDPSVTSVDVYLVTDKNRDGSDAVCTNSTDPFSILSYEFTLHASGPGTVTYGSWTDNLGFGVGLVSCGDRVVCAVSDDAWIAKGTRSPLSPGTYRVGSLAIEVTGHPVLDVVTGSPVIHSAETSFGSTCLGSNFNNTITLGPDFTDTDGTEQSNPVLTTVWDKIKTLYH